MPDKNCFSYLILLNARVNEPFLRAFLSCKNVHLMRHFCAFFSCKNARLNAPFRRFRIFESRKRIFSIRRRKAFTTSRRSRTSGPSPPSQSSGPRPSTTVPTFFQRTTFTAPRFTAFQLRVGQCTGRHTTELLWRPCKGDQVVVLGCRLHSRNMNQAKMAHFYAVKITVILFCRRRKLIFKYN